MAKSAVRFVCRDCGAVQSRWMGKCPDCGQWDTLEEYRLPTGGADKDGPRGGVSPLAGESGQWPKATPIGDVDQADYPRLATTIDELDRVLGGGKGAVTGADEAGQQGAGEADVNAAPKSQCGLVPGSVVLVGGDPGIGKSTLLLQAADRLAAGGHKVLYVSSEESAQQTRLRAARLGAGAQNLYLLADTNLSRIVEQVRQVNPAVVVIDSIQMIYKGDLPAAPGSVTQLRACCMELVYLAKATGVAVFLVGHVTKQGQLAGPRLLEHMVDTVIYFEGDRYHSHRIVRATKNRYGTTLEVGLFEMTDAGLAPVRDGSAVLAAEYRPTSGSVVCPVLQGSRCLLVELQALTATGFLGSVKRKTSGIDASRLAMLIAVLEKRGGLRLADQDVFVNSVGGMKVGEPAADLAIALAIAGAHLNRQIGGGQRGVCAVGEIGLGGEVRHVHGMAQRLAEAARLGFTHVVAPSTTARPPKGCELITAKTLDDALQVLS